MYDISPNWEIKKVEMEKKQPYPYGIEQIYTLKVNLACKKCSEPFEVGIQLMEKDTVMNLLSSLQYTFTKECSCDEKETKFLSFFFKNRSYAFEVDKCLNFPQVREAMEKGYEIANAEKDLMNEK